MLPPHNITLFELDFNVKFPLLRLFKLLSDLKSTISRTEVLLHITKKSIIHYISNIHYNFQFFVFFLYVIYLSFFLLSIYLSVYLKPSVYKSVTLERITKTKLSKYVSLSKFKLDLVKKVCTKRSFI